MKPLLYKTIIIDDEEHCRTSLKRTIDQYCPQLKVVDSVSNATEARKSIYSNNPDLIFLDVEMPQEDGFELIEQLGSKTIPTIFTTAYESYALKALKKQAVDYLLKPVDEKELIAAVNKLDVPQSVATTKVALPTSQGFIFCDPEEIIRCEADGSYTKIYKVDGTILVSRNIGYIEELLNNQDFFRSHKSHLVNLLHVKEYIRGRGGFAVMSDNAQIEISKRKREDFLLAIS